MGMSKSESMDIFYFSGTGNSLFLAKQLQQAFPGAQLKPLLRMMRERKLTTSAAAVGFVFPIHLSTLPYKVREFVDDLAVEGADYCFAAATRIGTYHSADLELDRILRRKGVKLDCFLIFNMPPNSPCGLVPRSFPGFKKMTREWPDKIAPERVAGLSRELEQRLGGAVELIQMREQHWDGRSPLALVGKHLSSALISLTRNSTRRQVLPFYADDSCSACGMCESVCLSGRIVLDQGRPLWRPEKECYFCYACFNSCPEEAILIRERYTEKRGRYLHPQVAVEEIAAQK